MSLISTGIAAILIPFIVEILKKYIDVRYAPLEAFALGVIIGLIDFYLYGGVMTDLLLQGIAIGGTSTGLYSLYKTTIKGN